MNTTGLYKYYLEYCCMKYGWKDCDKSTRQHLAAFHWPGRFGFINTNSVIGYEADLCAASLKQFDWNLRKRYWIYITRQWWSCIQYFKSTGNLMLSVFHAYDCALTDTLTVMWQPKYGALHAVPLALRSSAILWLWKLPHCRFGWEKANLSLILNLCRSANC